MKKSILVLFLLAYASSFAQSTSPYEWHWLKDGAWTVGGVGASLYGLHLIRTKDSISVDKLNSLNKDDINFVDRWVAGNSSEIAVTHGNIPFALSFAAPFALFFDDGINDHAGQITGLYIESLLTTSTIYTITAGLVDKSRPYVYDPDLSIDKRVSKNAQRSFYSGHVAAAATATFFAAKVYCDFNPDATGKGYIWAAAATLPAAVGYFRLQAGQHFLTDVLLGYGLGAATGILVPELHKSKNSSIDITPVGGRNFRGEDYTGMALRYTF